MRTVTFEKDFSIPRTDFKDINDFFIYLLENYKIQDNKVQFWILEQSEITSSLLEKVEKAKLSQIQFNNI